MSVIFNLAYNNRDDLIQQYVPKINKAIELPEKYYDVVRDLSLNNRLSTIKILFQIFLNNVNPNKNRKINELIENIKFDFVINATVLEPVIQVQYEIKMAINREKKPASKTDKEFILITPNGDLKTLNLNTSKQTH